MNPDGSVDAWLRLPASAPPGQYSLGLTCIDLDAVYDSASFELTVTGAVPTERPKKVADFSVTPLEGAPGDPLRVTGQCLVNGVPGDRVTATWIYPTDFEVADSRVILALPVAPDGTVDGTVVVPDDARPWLHGPFSNAISLRCESEGMAFGSKTFDFSLDGDDPPTPEPPAQVVSSFSFDRTSIRPGDTVAFDATCTIDGEPLAFLSFLFERNGSSIPVHEFFEPDSQGRLSGSFTVPYMRPGKVLLETACPGAGPFEFTVLEPRSSTPPPTEPPGPNDGTDNASTANDNGPAASLASTGAPPRGAWLASAAIALLGGAALLLTRRKTEGS